MKIHSAFATLVLLGMSGLAFAGDDIAVVPEPGVLELLSIGAIAALVIAIRKRRK